MPATRSDAPRSLQAALDAARRRERLSHAEWRRRRAEVARLIAAGEEAAASALVADLQQPTTATTPVPHEAIEPPAPSHDRTPKPSTPRKRPNAPVGKEASKPKAKPAAKAKKPAKTSPAAKKQPTKVPSTGWAAWVGRQPPWALSLATHGAAVVALSLLTFATFGESTLLLTAALSEDDAWSDMPAEVTLAELETDLSTPVAEPIDVTIEELTSVDTPSLVEPVELTSVAEFGDLSVSAEALMASVPSAGGEGDQAAEAGGGAMSSGKVSFFGAESEAGCVAFVVDNSGTMQQGRMETTLMELDAAVRRLTTSQRFYVVFYSDQAYPMFFPDPVTEPLPATRDNADRLTEWLRTVEICLGGRLLDAVELAAGVEPDVVYVLSDGDIRSTRIMSRLTAPGAWPFVIHTLGMGARTPQHAANLQAIAAASGGTFRPVAAHPAAVQAARLRPIRYHREPGAVWGSRVQAWK